MTATVVRVDDVNANLTLRMGPLRIAQGGSSITSSGDLVLNQKIAQTLHARGVSILDVTPDNDVINVRARVPFIGEIQVDLLRVQTSRT